MSERASGRAAGAKWTEPDAGRHYSGGRFRSKRAAGRDPAIVGRLLDERRVAGERILDAPCGTGRLLPALAGRGARVVGLDVSERMLLEAGGLARVRGEVAHLPFRDASFEAVVCCRLLHHLPEPELGPVARELVRVAGRVVIASFWDAASLPAWRVRRGLKRSEGERGRRAHPRAVVAAAFERAGGRVLGYRAVLRFVSQQTFVVVEVR